MSTPDLYTTELVGLYRRHAEVLPEGTEWFDAHTHTGQNDPDGMKATAAEILAGLDVVGHSRALVFTTMEPDGYPAANDRVLAEAAESGGRLLPLARLDPHNGPVAEAERCLDAGAVGIKLHPRAEQFALHDAGVEDIVRIADERKLPIMIHAGRGIPALGRDTVELATRYPGARLILAHAGISDLSWIWREAEHLPNLFFDTAWWLVADLLALFAHVPPGHILYASDLPYGHPVFNGLALLRCGAAVGLPPEAIAQIAGGHLAHLMDGGDPLDLGPAPGPPSAGQPANAPRVVQHLTGALSRVMVGADPTEPLALARLACAVTEDDPEHELLSVADGLIVAAEASLGGLPETRRAVAGPSVAAALIAGTPSVGV
jgi:predicted TIM-barrel fold metal-dependent hydrolase